MTIRAIETSYGGYRFRSRLEARWAVFFDAMGILYEYEAQGYVVNGTPYLPDFRLSLPDGNIVFAEVKNGEEDEHEGTHVELCRGLAAESGSLVLLLVGPPDYRLYNAFSSILQPTSFHAAFFTEGPCIQIADEYWFQYVLVDSTTGHLVWKCSDMRWRRKRFGRQLINAVKVAREARFEHGESPQ